VQFHPEAAAGPHDAGYLFERFAARMAAYRGRPHVPVERTAPGEPAGLPRPEVSVG